MRVRVTHWFLLLILCLSPSFAQGGTTILDIALTQIVQDRDPLGRYKPAAFCEKDQGRFGQIPTVILSSNQPVIFWNKVASTKPEVIRHTWHKKSEDGWISVAQVDMKIAQSKSYRIWSSKDLRQNFHRGEWMIVVALANKPKHILCISRFLVQ